MNAPDDSLIYLRDLVKEDVKDRYIDWFKDEEVTQFLSSKNLHEQEILNYLRNGPKTGMYRMYAVTLKETGLHVGNVKISTSDKGRGVYNLGILIGDKSVWGKGVATQAIKAATMIAFNNFGIHKLNAGAFGENIGSIKAFSKAGWVIEGRQIGRYIVDGKARDCVYMSCFNTKYFEPQNGEYVFKDVPLENIKDISLY